MFAHAIPQVDAERVGIHLLWSGPHPWVYSVHGWTVQRRELREQDWEYHCAGLAEPDIVAIRQSFESRLDFGTVTYRLGRAPVPVDAASLSPTPFVEDTCEVFTLELDSAHSWVRVDAKAEQTFLYAIRENKAVAFGGPVSGNKSHELAALGIDTVVVCAFAPTSVHFCIRLGEDEQWRDAVEIVSGLQIPIRELMPTLADADDELAEAKQRLLPDEGIDAAEFARMANTVRTGVPEHGQIRPIDQVLLMREDTSQSFQELVDTDPLRILVNHPKWRRVLGFAWFDDDPLLIPGATYEYRMTGFFPHRDLVDTMFGLHTVPSGTTLPVNFFIDDMHVQLPQPTTVELDPPPPDNGLLHSSRRGIRLTRQTEFFWDVPMLQNCSIALGFPHPVSAVVLDLAPGHHLEFAWRTLLGGAQGPVPVPAGALVRLDFPFPATELRLDGDGFLHSVRLPQGSDEIVPVSVVLPPVKLENAPLPNPPTSVVAHNLQAPQPVPPDDQAPDKLEIRHALGFDVRWRPSLPNGLTAWPPDAGATMPLEATLFEVEHNAVPSSIWEPLHDEENWILGDREHESSETVIGPGGEVMAAFPEIPPLKWSGELDLHWRDVFDFPAGSTEIGRPLPEPGTEHRYRVWVVDPIGRRSATPTTSTKKRLEKHVPPPLPVGPTETDAATLALPEPTGVQARVLVAGAADLTPADIALLGGDDNAIVLQWGWHDAQRDQDPYAREFRIYVADTPLDSVIGTLSSVTTTGTGRYDVTLTLDRPVVADAAKGLYLMAGSAFHIDGHGAGTTISAKLSVELVQPAAPVPQTGPIELPLHLTPATTRPPAWTKRIGVEPITATTHYEFVISNQLTLSASHRRDSAWVGVSTADDQFYVDDQLAPAHNRPGNESAIVPVACQGRYQGRPVFDIPPPLEPVPMHRAPEPNGRPVYFDLDLAPYLSGYGLTSGDLVQPYRAPVDTVLGAYDVDASDRIMAIVVDRHEAGEADVEVTVANPADRAAVIAGLRSADRRILADRYAVFLAASHPYRDRLFERVTERPVPLGLFKETLPNESGRYVYLLRKADAAGHLSEGDAVAKMVLRVPSIAPGGRPYREPSLPTDVPGTLRLGIPADIELTHLLVFTQVAADGPGPLPPADLLRIPNRPDLYPTNGIRLRAPNGTILTPLAKDLSDADIGVDASRDRHATFDLTADAGKRLSVWACALSRDGVPSAIAGPWSLAMPLAPLPTPTLSVAGPATAPTFSWAWPSGETYDVALHASADGVEWRRVSPVFGASTTGYVYPAGIRGHHYRLDVIALDARIATSNVVTPTRQA